MIVYTEQDKELVIPKGIGNLAGGSDYDSGYQDGYQVGYGEGRSYGYNKAVGDIRNSAIVLNVTENGTYSANTSDSIYFKEVNVNVGVDPSTWYASGYTDGYAAGYSTGVEEGFSQGYQSGSTDGFALGEATQRAKLVSTAVTENGTYSRRDGFSSFEVNIPEPYLGSGEVNMESILQTFGKNDLRPKGPNGEIVFGGDFEEFQNLIIEEGGVFQIKKWNNEEHTEYTLQLIMHPHEWAIFEDPFEFRPWSDIPSEWTNLINDLYARYDGTSIYFYWNYPYDGFFTDARDNILPDEVMLLDLAYDGISALTVNAQNIYDSGHTEGVISGYTKGYTDGQAHFLHSILIRLPYASDTGITAENISNIVMTGMLEGTIETHRSGNTVDITITGMSDTVEAYADTIEIFFNSPITYNSAYEYYNKVRFNWYGEYEYQGTFTDDATMFGGIICSANQVILSNNGTELTIIL